MRRRTKNRFLDGLRSTGVFRIESLIEAGYWLLLTVLGALPLWGGYFFLRAFSQSVSLVTFAETGEIAVFGAGILSSSIFEVTREMSPNLAAFFKKGRAPASISDLLKITFPYYRFFTIFSVALILVAALAFSIFTAAGIPEMGAPLDKAYVTNLSVVVLVGAMVIGFLVTAFGNTMSQWDFRASLQQEITQLGNEFDATGGV